jgi:hypothetical protein
VLSHVPTLVQACFGNCAWCRSPGDPSPQNRHTSPARFRLTTAEPCTQIFVRERRGHQLRTQARDGGATPRGGLLACCEAGCSCVHRAAWARLWCRMARRAGDGLYGLCNHGVGAVVERDAQPGHRLPNRRTTCTSCTNCVLACCNAHSCARACGLAQGVREDALLALARDLLQRGLDPNAPAVERTTRASAATFIVAGALQHPRLSVHFKDRAPPADGRRSP